MGDQKDIAVTKPSTKKTRWSPALLSVFEEPAEIVALIKIIYPQFKKQYKSKQLADLMLFLNNAMTRLQLQGLCGFLQHPNESKAQEDWGDLVAKVQEKYSAQRYQSVQKGLQYLADGGKLDINNVAFDATGIINKFLGALYDKVAESSKLNAAHATATSKVEKSSAAH